MATKQFCGPVDCLGAALDDEEYFLLLARDPLAPWLVAIWASMRLGDFNAASANFQRMFGDGLLDFYKRNPDQAKAEEAISVANRMREWRTEALGPQGSVPKWKTSRSLGMERFVVAYIENHPEEGPRAVRIANDDWPAWSRPLWAGEPLLPDAEEQA